MTNYLAGTTLPVGEHGAISWEALKEFFGAEYPAFEKWMTGQTCVAEGAYAWDVEKYIKGSRIITD